MTNPEAAADNREAFGSKQAALKSIAGHAAGNMEAIGLEMILDGMGIRFDSLTAAQRARAEEAVEEVCRRLRRMGGKG